MRNAELFVMLRVVRKYLIITADTARCVPTTATTVTETFVIANGQPHRAAPTDYFISFIYFIP